MFKKAVLIGANGSMGAKIAAIIASFGEIPVYMVARDIGKAKRGIEIAVASVRSDAIRKNLIPATYGQLPHLLKQCDWVVEAVTENYETKQSVNRLIAKTNRKGRVISTVTSGLSITTLLDTFEKEDRSRYLGIHFFNPPYKMLLCEIVPTEYTDKNVLKELTEYLQKRLLRVVIRTKDVPAFAANRVGFQFINEAALFAEKYKNKGGIAYIDSLLGRHTGRSLAPLETLDFVGLDIHQAIVGNIHENLDDHAKNTFILPGFIKYLIKKGSLGIKSGEGLYALKEVNGTKKKYVFDIKTGTYIPGARYESILIDSMRKYIRTGNYKQAFNVLMKSAHPDADIIRYFIARYISYAFSLVGSVVLTKEIIDRAMAYGFNWLPPSALVDLLGGVKNTISLIKKYQLPVPAALTAEKKSKLNFYTLQSELDYRSFIKA